MKRIIIIIFSTAVVALVSCSGDALNIAGGKGVIEEIKRVPSPDKKVEAVLVETRGGAFLGFQDPDIHLNKLHASLLLEEFTGKLQDGKVPSQAKKVTDI